MGICGRRLGLGTVPAAGSCGGVCATGIRTGAGSMGGRTTFCSRRSDRWRRRSGSERWMVSAGTARSVCAVLPREPHVRKQCEHFEYDSKSDGDQQLLQHDDREQERDREQCAVRESRSAWCSDGDFGADIYFGATGGTESGSGKSAGSGCSTNGGTRARNGSTEASGARCGRGDELSPACGGAKSRGGCQKCSPAPSAVIRGASGGDREEPGKTAFDCGDQATSDGAEPRGDGASGTDGATG